jgi:hypothetical protein
MPQLFRGGFRERTECGLAAPGTLNDRFRNALANAVVFAAREFSANSIERDVMFANVRGSKPPSIIEHSPRK